MAAISTPTPGQLAEQLGRTRSLRAARLVAQVDKVGFDPVQGLLTAFLREHEVEVRIRPDGSFRSSCTCGINACAHADAAMMAWARKPAAAPRPATPAAPKAPAVPEGDALLQALVDAGLAHLLEQPLRLALAVELPASSVPVRAWGSERLGSVLAQLDLRPGVPGSAHARQVADAVREHLRVEGNTVIDTSLQLARPDASVAGQPLLDRLLARYRADRAVLGGIPRAPKLEGYHLHEDDDWVSLHLLEPRPFPQIRRVRIQLSGADAGQVRCDCGAPRCRAAQLATGLLAWFLLCPHEQPALAGRVLATLVAPDWRDGVDRLVAALAPIDASWPDEEGRLPGWELEGSGTALALSPVLVRAFTRKEGMRVWKTASHLVQEGLHRLPLPADRAVAPLFQYSQLRDSAAISTALQMLADHPRLLHEGQPLGVRRGRLLLRFTHGEDGARLSLHLGALTLGREHLRQLEVAATRAAPLPLLDADARVAWLIDLDPRLLPALARALRVESWPPTALVRLLPALSRELLVEVDDEIPASRRPADALPCLALELGADGALRVDLGVRPLPEAAPCAPGAGSRRQWAHEGEALCFADRDLEAERAAAHGVADHLGLGEPQRPWGWTVHEPDALLSVLDRLDALDPVIPRTWSGPAPRVLRAGIADLHLKVHGGGGWLDIGATVQVDGEKIDLAQLRDALRQGRNHVELSPGQWLRMAKELAASLSALDGQAEVTDGGLRLAELAAEGLRVLEQQGAVLSGDKGWKALAGRIAQAEALSPEPVPGLRATLRPYQEQGLLWLRRRAAWAPGAVLADDMGLGKTVQGLALLLDRRAQGPALVVAPTSVGFNWVREAGTFAPDLRVLVYRGVDRAAQLLDLHNGDLVVTSWDLLARDEEALAAVPWGTVILDEAQAIKNAATRRARASRKLQAGFTVALTGTPLENNVGELWSLFRAVVPGLLGSQERFRARFEAPIVRRDDPAARAALAALLRPFLLRRTKAEVARELPSRQEILVPVELSADERALYEAARLDALERIASGEDGRFNVLAALTRLRQLACHGRLVLPDAPVGSAKLEAVRELLAEIRGGGHRALVFSQFRRHLDLVGEALAAEGYRLRRIDGSTPAEARQREVDAFQRGEGDVFLISLKAGGTGLNLTAASYVLHLDPWWNPAVEDQATDRAHRIGQTQPVTVYRLVAQQTVEQAIVALHERKRALADALIAGADGGAALSVEELVGLIRGDEAPDPPSPAPPAPPAPVAAAPVPALPPTWLPVLQADLEAELGAGRLTAATRRNYGMAAEHLAAWVGLRAWPVARPADLEGAFAAYCEDVAAGTAPVGRKTDLTLGRPAIRRWVALLEAAH